MTRSSHDRTASSPLIDDLPCLHCLYNLRGLSAEMACPECGAPVSHSTAAHLPRANSRWLKLVRVGVLIEIASLLAAFLATGWGWTARVGPPDPLVLLSKVLFALGLYFITTPETRLNSLPTRMSLRITVRVLAVLSLAGFLLPNAPGTYFLDALGWSFEIAGALAAFGCYFFLRWIAARVPHRDLVRRTTIVMSGLLAVHVAGILLEIAGIPIGLTAMGGSLIPFMGPRVSVPMMMLALTYLLAAFAFNILNVLLLVRYEDRLRVAARIAQVRGLT